MDRDGSGRLEHPRWRRSRSHSGGVVRLHATRRAASDFWRRSCRRAHRRARRTVATMKIAIVGGGLTGVSLGYFLSRHGVSVDIFEASPVLGGLAGPLVLEDGTAVDRFYHAILPSDDHLWRLCHELAIDDQLRFQQTRNAFYVDGAI